jgi:transposase
MKFLYLERDAQKRADYQEKLKAHKVENIVYLDESGFTNGIVQDKAWSPIGQPALCERSGKRTYRVNLFCGLDSSFHPLAPYLTVENCNGDNFELWFETHFLWTLYSTKPRAVIVMDNARFHRKQVLFELIQRFNQWYDCDFKLLFLPPYSPDFNPIEKYFGTRKQKLKRCIKKFESLEDAIWSVL